MKTTIADRIGEGRRQGFVGRAAELTAFRTALQTPDQAAVLFVHGPAGVGKSTLVRRMFDISVESGARTLLVDARDLPPTLDALAFRWSPVLDDSGASEERTVVLVDAYELLADIDHQIREQLAVRLPGDALLIIAGQDGPSIGWRTDPGWSPLVRVVKLANFTAAESGAYLSNLGVSPDVQQTAIQFTHGHPLALALVGEVIKAKGLLAEADSVDVVQVLVERFLQSIPSRSHRQALEASALVRVVDEGILAALLQTEDAAEIFAWLRRLPFVDPGVVGLYLHDLPRQVLATDLQWRNPKRFQEYHDRARTHYLSMLENADAVSGAAVLMDLIYLHPDLRRFLQPPDDGASMQMGVLQEADIDPILQQISMHEGDESAAIGRHWLTRQPGAWLVIRDPAQQVLGALCLLDLGAISQEDQRLDPAVAAAFAGLRSHPPLRPEERVTLIRFWLSREDYQSVSPVQSLIATALARHYLTTSGLAVTVLPFAYPEDWQAFCEYADQRRAVDADFDMGGRHYSAYTHDWRTVPPAAWVAQMSLREIGATPAMPTQRTAAGLLVLSREDFFAAVRQALRDYTRTDRLRNSPLLRCRIVVAGVGNDAAVADKVALLQSQLKSSAETLNGSPADRRLYRVIVRSYLSPAPSLERAAEVLELPSSTFRRLLGNAVSRIATLVWHAELET
jgi:hypothetical protein